MIVGIIGSGGREHAICYKLKQSKKIGKLICLPGNAGTEKIAKNIEVDISNFNLVYETIKDEKINIIALFYIIKSMSKIIDEQSNGSTIKGISKTALSKIKIKLPKNKKLIDDLNPMFQEIEEHQQAVKNADELYKKYIQELINEAIPPKP